jgi:hypothetical protein
MGPAGWAGGNMANKLAGQRAKFSRARAIFYSTSDDAQRHRDAELMAEVLAEAPVNGFTEDDVTPARCLGRARSAAGCRRIWVQLRPRRHPHFKTRRSGALARSADRQRDPRRAGATRCGHRSEPARPVTPPPGTPGHGASAGARASGAAVGRPAAALPGHQAPGVARVLSFPPPSWPSAAVNPRGP